MHKVLISQPSIGSYSAFLLCGLVTGYILTRWRGPRAGIKGSHIDNLTLLAAGFGLFGARFVSWWFYFPPGVSLWKALTDSGGGMVFYGGMIFGMVTVIGYALATRIPLGNLMDVFAPGLAIGLAFGRIGCFMAGCCWGDLCAGPEELAKLRPPTLKWQLHTVPALSHASFPLAVRFPPGAGAYEQHLKLGLIDSSATRSRPVHPVQLYEAFLAVVLCVGLHRSFKHRSWQGEIVCYLFLGYAVIRFCTEFLRGDNTPAYFHLTLSQVISVIMGTVAGSVILAHRFVSARPLQEPEVEQAGVPNVAAMQD